MANYRVSTNTNNGTTTTKDKTNKKQQKQRNINQFRWLTLKHEFLKIYVNLQTAFAAETHLAEGQWLEEQVNVVKLWMFEQQPEGQLFRGEKGNI
jgi:hypothetical protein